MLRFLFLKSKQFKMTVLEVWTGPFLLHLEIIYLTWINPMEKFMLKLMLRKFRKQFVLTENESTCTRCQREFFTTNKWKEVTTPYVMRTDAKYVIAMNTMNWPLSINQRDSKPNCVNWLSSYRVEFINGLGLNNSQTRNFLPCSLDQPISTNGRVGFTLFFSFKSQHAISVVYM